MSAEKKLWALMHYSMESGECYGVTDSEDVATAWADADFEHAKVELKLNTLTEMPTWVRGKKLTSLKTAIKRAGRG